MNYSTLDEAYEANNAVRSKLKATVAALSEEQLKTLPDGENWSIRQIVEHVAMVNDGVFRICSKLLSKAEEDDRPNGGFVISNDFIEKANGSIGVKLQAPERVQPIADASIEESFAKLDENVRALETLREKFERFDGREPKFPHPYFGDLSAQEWFALSSAHEKRHLAQIRRIIEKLG